jgi:hypothetical protein
MMAGMKIRLSGGVVASGRRAWLAGRSGPAEVVDEPVLPLGAPVALGPQDASAEQVRHAVDELGRLVSAAGPAAAGAGVDLGSGFRSARLTGARGDQRDAVLAALRVLGVAQADRLGDRAGFLVALLGPAATKRVGAAVTRAIAEERWAAVTLAAAASDLLWPEQLEQVLALEPPPGTDVVPGPASALAQHLRLVLGPFPEPRRLDLLLDLWARVAQYHAGRTRRERLLGSQSRRSRVGDLRKRRQHLDDQRVLGLLRASVAQPESQLAEVARWTPPDSYWRSRLDRLVQDAFAAAALLRTAVAVADHGLEEGLARSADLLSAAETLLPAAAADAAAHKVPGLTGLPARPGTYVRDINRRLAASGIRDHRLASFVPPRLACARDFALAVMADVSLLLVEEPWKVPEKALRSWADSSLWGYRKTVGYSPLRAPAEWADILVPPWTAEIIGIRQPLAQRLAAEASSASGASDPAEVEVAADLLWYAELVDALAALHGHPVAHGPHAAGFPWLDYDPAPATAPLTPRLDSVTLAVSGAAQLVALGGAPPKRVRTWPDLTSGLLAGISIAEAVTGEFVVPGPLAALDGTTITGTAYRVRVARSARTLAEWSDYMGNCIAGQYYVDRAKAGRSVLTGLYDKKGVLVVNAELVPRRPAVRGWRVNEIQARFNQAPDEALERRFRAWVEDVRAADASENAPAQQPEPPPARTPRRRAVPRLVEEVGPALGPLAQRAWTDEVDDAVLGVFAALAGTAQEAALARLRRLGSGGPGPGALADACRRALDAGAVTLPGLWAAGGTRPLRTAVAALDPALGDHCGQLALLFGEPPLAKTLRKLVRQPAIADAYALDLVARSVRRSIGDLASRDDPVISRALAGRTSESVLCALTVLINCRAPGIDLTTVTPPQAVSVPGYPATLLDEVNGPWLRAFPDARELGADTSAFLTRTAEHGLRVPASWLAGGTWTALWARAHR